MTEEGGYKFVTVTPKALSIITANRFQFADQ
jgi:hypothetical protein